jgi:hypothetical protein
VAPQAEVARRIEAAVGIGAGAAGLAALVFDLFGPVYQTSEPSSTSQGLLAAGLAPAAAALVFVVAVLCLTLAGAAVADARRPSGRALGLIWGSALLLLGAAALSAASIGLTLLPAAALGLVAAGSASVGRSRGRGRSR